MKKLLILLLLPLALNAQIAIITGCAYPARATGGGTTPADTVPDAYSFTDVTGASTGTSYTSNAVTVSGINTTTHISISGGEFNKNGGGYGTTRTTVVNGDVISVRITSSGSYSTAVNSTLTIGVASDTYTVTTGAAPIDYRADIASRNSHVFFVGVNSFEDRAMTNPATLSGDNILAVKDYNSSRKLEFNSWTPTNPITNNNGQTSTFYGAAWGSARTYPPLDTKLGGSIVSSNTSYKNYSTTFADVPFPHEITTVFSWMGTVYGEFLTSGCYSASLRRGYFNDLMIQWGCIGGEQTKGSGTWRGAFMETVIVHQTIYANNWMTTRWTYSGGDQVKVDSSLLSVGPGVLRDQYIMSNGHPPNVRIYSHSIKVGSVHTPATRQLDINSYKQLYNIGQTPNEPFCVPVLTEGGSGTGTYFDVTLNYNDGGTGLPINLSAVTLNWGGTKKPNSGVCGGCNFLDIQQLLKTTDGNTTRIYVSEFPAFFDTEDNNHTVTLGATCPNTSGQSFGIVTAENGYY